MKYIFRLELKKESSKLILLGDESIVSERAWPEARDMGTKLFAAMAEMLEEQGFEPADVSDFAVESELPDVYTSTRIAETVKKVYGFAVKRKETTKK